MTTKTCTQCGAPFEPARSTQQYCSQTCSRRHRDHAWRERHSAPDKENVRLRLAIVTGEHRDELKSVKEEYQRSLDRATREIKASLTHEINRREMELDRLHARLRELATINVDLCGDIAEMKAQGAELQLENARLMHTRTAETEELTQIAGRLLELSTRLGIPVDSTTKKIFQRHGWRTQALVTDR